MAESALASPRVEPRRQPEPGRVALVLLAVSVALNLALAAFLVMRGAGLGTAAPAATAINHDSYYAVFLNNKEAFVGHITAIDPANVSMSDIYYLTFDPPKDAAGNPIANASPSDYKPALKKLGQEVWGPKDFVLVNRQNMEYYTELRPDSKIVQAIQAFQTPKK